MLKPSKSGVGRQTNNQQMGSRRNGVNEMTVSRWRTNKVQPSVAQLVEIARLLKVDIKDLIEADFDYEIEE